MKLTVVLAGILFCLAGSTPFARAEDVLALHHQGKKAVPSAPVLPNQSSLGKVSEKLDKLLKGQDEILREFEEIKKELYVIKVRASR